MDRSKSSIAPDNRAVTVLRFPIERRPRQIRKCGECGRLSLSHPGEKCERCAQLLAETLRREAVRAKRRKVRP